MRNLFNKQPLEVNPEFSTAMEKLGERTTDIRAFDLMQSYIRTRIEQVASSPNVVELYRYQGKLSDTEWQEQIDFEKYVEVAKAIGKTQSTIRIYSETERPFDYESEEVS